jgi:hypothetical protein
MARYGRFQRPATTVARFLNFLINPTIIMSPHSTDYAWVGDAQQTGKNRYMQLGYSPVGVSVSNDDFTDNSKAPPISRIPADEYYSAQGLALGALLLPDSFQLSLDSASQLPPESYAKLFIALTFFAMSASVWSVSRSASYASLVAAVEALLPEDSQQRCQSCGQRLYQISKRFRDFLTTYAPGEEKASERKVLQHALYELRSGLTHGSKILQADLEPWKFQDRRGQVEDDLHRKLASLVRLAIMNWLSCKNPAAALAANQTWGKSDGRKDVLKRRATTR